MKFQLVIFKLITLIDDCGISCGIAFSWMSLDVTDDKSTLVQVMAWCRQATSHYLKQCWPRCMSPYGVNRPQCVNSYAKIILCMDSANQRCHYNVMSSLIGWANTQNDPNYGPLWILYIPQITYWQFISLNMSQKHHVFTKEDDKSHNCHNKWISEGQSHIGPHGQLQFKHLFIHIGICIYIYVTWNTIKSLKCSRV